MRSALLGVVSLVTLAFAASACATGSAVPSDDGGTYDAPADVAVGADGAAHDGPRDGPITHDAGSGDGHGGADGAPADGPKSDAGAQHDGGCAVQNTGACDVVCQNCGGGNRCVIDANNHQLAACIANGTVSVGGMCTATATDDNCLAGAICLSEGKCVPFCRQNADCTAYNGLCIIGISWSGTTPFKACKLPDSCDPVANTGCTSPKGCFLGENDNQTFCLTAGSGGQGTACPSGNECQGGYLCVGSGTYTCRQVCRFSPPSSCPNGTTCQTVTGLTNYGACI